MARKTVCIVGAGPAGLVAAKVLLQTQRFDVTIFEKGSRIGGIWALDQHSEDGFLSPQTPTNLSRFTVSFSDLAWTSLDLSNIESSNASYTPIFPKAWQVGRYLEEYQKRYVSERCLHLDTAVSSVEHTPDDQWTVSLITQANKQSQQRFDHVIMASGFFAQPRPIQQSVSRVHTENVKLVHSSAFRSLDALFSDQESILAKTILVIGGGNSAGEAAGVLAGQISSAQNSLDPARRKRYRDVRILHVTPRSLYAMPPFLPADATGQHFQPLDFGFYDLSKRPRPVVAAAGISSQEMRDFLHGSVQTSLGNDQSDLGSAALVAPGGKSRGAVQVALSESYPEFVRSGLISVAKGRVMSLEDDGTGSALAVIDHKGQPRQVDSIGAVLYATGYSPVPALDILDEGTKEQLHFDKESMRLPLILEQWQTMNESVPSIAFHGFYEGPYWGVMEMQARLTASRWLGGQPLKPNAYEAQQTMLELRQAMHEKKDEVPQYWLGDYAGYMEEMAAALHLKRNDGSFGDHDGPVSPPRYLDDNDNIKGANAALEDLANTYHACKHGKYAARAVIRALQGKWNMSRRIESQHAALPSGTVEGTATFHPRASTPDKSDLTFDVEYLYSEHGIFRPDAGGEMTVTRSYVYRYSEARDDLSVWFVKPDSPYEVDYLFHNLVFVKDEVVLVAKADHLCVADQYDTEYRFSMKGVLLTGFELQHAVEGPQKKYTAVTAYVRPKIDSDPSEHLV